MWKLFTYGKIKSGRKLTKKNQKQKKNRSKKKNRKKTGSKKRERLPFCLEKKKILYEATGTGGALRWRPDFEQRSRRQT